jgi:hypothetical protein
MISSYLDLKVKTACNVNGVQLQADLSGSGMMADVMHRSSTHKIKTHNRIIEVGISERSTIVGVVGITNGDGFFHGGLFAVVQFEFQFQEMTGF